MAMTMVTASLRQIFGKIDPRNSKKYSIPWGLGRIIMIGQGGLVALAISAAASLRDKQKEINYIIL
jgi:hypothetical protein